MRRFKISGMIVLSVVLPSTAQQVINGSRTLLGNWDASGAATTKPVKAGTAIPASCNAGEMFFKFDASPGANLYLCTATNTWTQIQGTGSGSGTVTNTGGLLGLDLPLFGAGGNDIKTGTKTGGGNQVVLSLSPTIVQPVIADFTNMLHGHGNPAGGGQLSLSAILPANLSGNGTKLGTVIGTQVAGNCVKFDSGGNIVDSGSACGTGGAVAGVFGRTGQVTAQSGDYTFGQISGTATTGQLPSSLQYFQLGTGPPAGTCNAGQNAYVDSTNLDYWFCAAANIWKKVISTANSGPFSLTGQTGGTPATPAAGLETIYLSSSDKTLHTVSDAGTDLRYAGLGEANTWGAFLQDFSASTMAIPVAAGLTTTASGAIGYDSTANQLHAAISGADSIIPTRAVSAPTGGNCVKWGSNFQLQDSGSVCAGGSLPGGSNTQLQYNNSGVLAGAADFAYVTHTLTGGASAIVDLTAQAQGTFKAPCPTNLGWAPWGISYPGTGAAVNTAANGGVTQIAFIPTTVCMDHINFTVETASGIACTGGTCGLVFEIASPDLGTVYCVSTVATSGGSPDINSLAVKQKTLTWSSGLNVSAGVCKLPGGVSYTLVTSSDSTVLKLNNYLFGGDPTATMINISNSKYFGVAASVTTGNGASLAFTSLSGLTWTANSAVFQIGFIK